MGGVDLSCGPVVDLPIPLPITGGRDDCEPFGVRSFAAIGDAFGVAPGVLPGLLEGEMSCRNLTDRDGGPAA